MTNLMYQPAFLRQATTGMAVLGILTASASLGAQKTRKMGLSDLAKIVRMPEAQISPDGRSVALVLSRPDYENNRYESELVLIDVSSKASRTLASGRLGMGTVRWSPAGDRIAFLARVDSGGHAYRQVLVMPIAGGDARPITSAPDGVQQFAWRPDGREIALVSADTAERRPGEERHNDSFEVGNNDYLTTEAPRPAHLWIVPSHGGKARRITSGAWTLSTSLASSPSLSWSPDGKSIAFARIERPHSGDSDRSTAQIVDVATGSIRALTRNAGREDAPTFSRDGSHIAFSYPRDGAPGSVDEVNVFDIRSGSASVATRELDRSILSSAWMPDGNTLLVLANDGTRTGLWAQPLDAPARRLDLGDVVSVSGVTVGANGAIAFLGAEATRPPELYYMAMASVRPRRLTDLNAELARLALGRSEALSWVTRDGMRANGVLTYPPDWNPRSRYPLVLLIHGGPTGTSTEAFFARAQLMAARGWIVFQPNYRGSDNLGNAFQRAIVNDASEGPGEDIMAGIGAIKERGLVDTTRIAVSGWSYGGALTAWLIGRYSGWRAAVAGAAPIDLTDMYSLSDINVIPRHALVESPWIGDNARKLHAQSAIAHLSRIRTPTLILSNTGDSRVAITGSYKLFHALRDNSVPVQFVAYPASGHSPSDPVRQRDVERRWLEWLDRYLGTAAPIP